MNDSSQNPDDLKKPSHTAKGLALLYAVSLTAAFGVMPFVYLLPSPTGTSGIAELMIPVGLMIPVFVSISYAFALPLLWFRGTIARCCFAMILPAPLWVAFLLGIQFAADGMPFDLWNQATAVLLMALVGGFVPISLVMGVSRWRLGIGESDPIPIGVNDFLALIAFIAIVLAFLRQAELFGGVEAALAIVLVGVCFYGLVGAGVASSLLLAIRFVLAVDGRRFHPMYVVGICSTLLLVTTAWSLLVLAESAGFSQGFGAVVDVALLSGMSWGIASASALSIAWWLRRYGCQLTTAATEKQLAASPHASDPGEQDDSASGE